MKGAFAPMLASSEEAIQVVLKAIRVAGYSAENQVALALDVAASELLKPGKNDIYIWEKEECTGRDLMHLYKEWLDRYPIISIEDGLGEEDWDSWVEMTKMLAQKVQLVGDDLFVTQIARLKKGHKIICSQCSFGEDESSGHIK